MNQQRKPILSGGNIVWLFLILVIGIVAIYSIDHKATLKSKILDVTPGPDSNMLSKGIDTGKKLQPIQNDNSIHTQDQHGDNLTGNAQKITKSDSTK